MDEEKTTTEPTTETVEETTEPVGGESADTGETTVEMPTEETPTEDTADETTEETTPDDTTFDNLVTTANEEPPADSTTVAYKPVFNSTVRTAIYVVCLLASVIGLGFMCFGYADIGGYISTAAGVIASGFGVAYNPIRTSN